MRALFQCASAPLGTQIGVPFKTIRPPEFHPELLPGGIRQDEGDFPGLVLVQGELCYITYEAGSWRSQELVPGHSLVGPSLRRITDQKVGRPDRWVTGVVVVGGIREQLVLFPNGPPCRY